MWSGSDSDDRSGIATITEVKEFTGSGSRVESRGTASCRSIYRDDDDYRCFYIDENMTCIKIIKN